MPPTLPALARFFLKLGTLAFGGPAVHIAMMEDELVRRRGWISADEFVDLLAMSNLLPGPSSTELAIFIGYRLRGVRGLLVAGICFILPAFLMVWALAIGYVRYGHLPGVTGILYGLKPVVLAIVVQALWRLGQTAVKTKYLAALGAAALTLCVVGCQSNPGAVRHRRVFAGGLLGQKTSEEIRRADAHDSPITRRNLSAVSQIRLRRLWQRICPVGLSPRGFGH